ncbi:ABC transporter ATP-binding protein [Mesorhizobium sp. L2C085B000]|uniref:ABC transporter ATP-binding protein n=1 Tax=Mesorhizobium sp. L2C085B000 TaxID=1287117 RepID=UPI0004CF667B|nr:ABC transporter ATP-binding protein [Mesorhizobium sp. L2C085B000]
MPGVSIHIDNVTKRYGTVSVIRDVSLDIAPGEFLSLLGPSGSGKSTILMSLAGFTHPTKGVIRIDERDVTDLAPRSRNIGMVFQQYALFPHMTVEQNIAFPLLQRGMAKSEIGNRIEAITKLVGLVGLEKRPAPNLSGGQQQRVALARALVFQPPVLLMDEPLGALDKKMREHLQVEIKEIQRVTGTTVVFVTHDQSEALGMSDRLAVLNHGTVEQIGTPEELYDAPANAFVADFIGEANILSGTLVGWSDERCAIRIADGSVVEGTPIGNFPLQSETPVELVVRPRSIKLDQPKEGSLCGQVLSSSYFGESVSVRIKLAGGSEVTAKEPPTLRRVAGENLSVSWSYQNARVFQQKGE